jgi:hypothetical protein
MTPLSFRSYIVKNMPKKNCFDAKFQHVMREGYNNKLHSGKGGSIVHSPAQMKAIAAREARKHCGGGPAPKPKPRTTKSKK